MAKSKNIVAKTKGSTISLLIVLIAVCWLVVVAKTITNDDAANQAEMIKSAQVFIDEGTYARAISIYKEALKKYNTVNNDRIEGEISALYKKGNMEEEYLDFVKSRINSGKANEVEYVDLINSYMEAQSYSSAIKYLKAGTKAYPEDLEMRQMYENLKYVYRSRALNYNEVKVPSDNWYIPAFDGEKWGYVDEDGRTLIDFKYDEVTAFYGKYAVAKENGVYILVDNKGYKNAVDKNNIKQVTQLCSTFVVGQTDDGYGIFSNTFKRLIDEKYENIIIGCEDRFFILKDGKWALYDGKFKPLTDFIFKDVCTNVHGEVFYKDYAVVADVDGYYMINRSGQARFSERFSAAKGIESGMVAAKGNNGKWGFIDETGEFIIKPEYEDAKSFSSGLAAVKVNDKWGYVNKYGDIKIECNYAEAGIFMKDKAIVIDSLSDAKVLTLKYYNVYN